VVNDEVLFLSALETPDSKSVKSLNVDFIPSYTHDPRDSVNSTLGFAYHNYSRHPLDTSLNNYHVSIPRSNSPFKIDLNIIVSGVSADGNNCSDTIVYNHTRPDTFYTNTELNIPSNAIPDISRYNNFTIPGPTAQSIVLATANGNWNGVYETVRVSNQEGYLLRKPEVPIRIALFGDVGPKDYETIRDYLEVLAVIAPDLDIEWATTVSEVNLPMHLISCTEIIREADMHCNTSGPSGAFSDQWKPYRGTIMFPGYGYLRLSDQRSNRHTLTHEFGHAFGLFHSEITDTSMGPGYDQASYWGAHDLMTLATIHNSSVTHGQTREEVRDALGIADDATWQGFVNDTSTLAKTPDDTWVEFGNLLKRQASMAR